MFSVTAFRTQLIQILHLQESPHRTALAFAIGVFIAFAPHYGFHTLSVVFCAWLFRLNYLAVLLGALINNPWTFVPILAGTLYTGFTLLGMPQSTPLDWQEFQVGNLYNMISPYIWPFVVGGCALGIAGALAAYPLILFIIHRSRSVKRR